MSTTDPSSSVLDGSKPAQFSGWIFTGCVAGPGRGPRRRRGGVRATWQLPSEIVDACALHHQNECAGAHVRIVRIADALASALDGELDLQRCAELGLDDLAARKLFEQLKSELAKDRRN